MIHGNGLQLNPPDERDFILFKKKGQLGGFYDQPALSELPEQFIIEDEFLYDQGQTDACAHAATCGSSSVQEGVKLDWKSSFGFGKLISGDPEVWGQNLRTACRSHVKIGAIEEKEMPEELQGKDLDFWRNPANWAKHEKVLKDLAVKHRKESFVAPKGNYDAFDNIRTAIWMYRNEKRHVNMGVVWGWPSSQKEITDPDVQGYGHALRAVGWADQDTLIVKNSWGDTVPKGLYLLSREVVNKNVSAFGAYMFIDLDPAVAKYYAENGASPDSWWLTQLLVSSIKMAIDLLKKALADTPQTGVPPYPGKITQWAKAIERMEGYFPGSRSYRNKNPGNFKFVGQYRAIGKDDKGFAIFPSYEIGFDHLCRVLYNACSGVSAVYKPDMTLYSFFEVYAPSSDDNYPKGYAEFVAKLLNVDPATHIKNLLA